LNNFQALEVAPGCDLGILSELPELILVDGLVFASRPTAEIGGGDLGVDSHAELADSRLNLGLHLLLALPDYGGVAELGHVWW